MERCVKKPWMFRAVLEAVVVDASHFCFCDGDCLGQG